MIDRILTVGGFTLVSRLTGFLRDIMLAAILGAGPVADAFFVAFRLPNHFRAIFAEGAFNAAFIPAYARIRTQGGPQAAELFGDRIFTLLIATQVVLLALALLFTPQAIELLAPGFSREPQQFALAVNLTRITFPYLLLITLVTLWGGILNALHRFAAAAAAPILLNLSMMATLALAAFFGGPGHAAAWGVLISGVLQAALVGGDTWRAGVMTSFRALRWDDDVRRFFKALAPATIGSAGTQLALFADTIIASFLSAGALSALYYADRIDQLPIGVIGIAVGTVLLPEMTQQDRGRRRGGRPLGAEPGDRIRAAAGDPLRRRLPGGARSHHARLVHARPLHGRRRACGGHDADGLHDRPCPLRPHSQRRRAVPRPRRHRDAGQGGADRDRGQHRFQDRAHGFDGAGRAGAGDLDRRLDQFHSRALASPRAPVSSPPMPRSNPRSASSRWPGSRSRCCSSSRHLWSPLCYRRGRGFATLRNCWCWRCSAACFTERLFSRCSDAGGFR